MKTIILILFSISFCISNAQDVKKALKKLDNAKTSDLKEASTILNQAYKMYKYNSAACYGLSVVYAHPEYDNPNLYEAFRYAKESQKTYPNYAKTKKGELANLSELFNEDSIQPQIDRIEDKLFERVRQEKSLKAVDEFITKVGGAKYQREALHMKGDLEFDNAQRINTSQALSDFIKKYPYFENMAEAIKIRNKLALNEVKMSNSIPALDMYIQTYGTENEYLEEAKDIRNQIAYDQIRNSGSIEGCNDFISKYPDAKQLKDVQALRDKLTIERMKNASSRSDFKDVNSKYSGDNYISGLNLKSDFLGGALLTQNKYSKDNIDWVRVLDHNEKDDKATGMALTNSNEIIVAGYTKQGEKWYNDAWIAKLNTQGKILWEKQLGSKLDDIFSAIAPTNDNGFVAVGHYEAKGAVNGRIWIIKIDANGNTVWEKFYEKSGALAVGVSQSNQIVVAGYEALANGNRSFILIKLDASGNEIWNKVFPGEGQTKRGKGVPNSVVINAQDQILCGGEYWTIKLDASGTKIWEYYNPEYYKTYSITFSSDGGVVLGGRYYDFNKPIKSDLWVAKLDANGAKSWEKTYDKASLHDIGYSLVEASSGNLYLAGLSDQGGDKDDDVWILKLDNQGNKTEDINFGSTDNEKSPNISIAPDGSLYLFGSNGFPSDNFLVKFK